MKVLLASPLRQDEDILRAHLDSVKAMTIPDGVTLEQFYVVNDDEKAIPILKEYGIDHTVIDTRDTYTKTSRTHIWTGYNLTKMETLRNRCIDEALKRNADYLFFVDTDIVLHPLTLSSLISAKKDLVAECFWTKGPDGNSWANAWIYDQCDTPTEEGRKWTEPGLYEVGGTGACFLISRAVLDAGVNYSRIPNLLKAVYGEDRWFCIRAACLGFKIYLDTHAEPTHLYTRTAYESWRAKCSQK